MERKLNPKLILLTGIAVIGISLYVNYTSYRNLFFGKMIVFIVIGGLMFLYGLFRHVAEKPAHSAVVHRRITPSPAHHSRAPARHPAAHPLHPSTHAFCAGCGVPLPAHARFCPRCGRQAR